MNFAWYFMVLDSVQWGQRIRLHPSLFNTDGYGSLRSKLEAPLNCQGHLCNMKEPLSLESSESKLYLCSTLGKATGIVTTTRITHATPAATYAHIVERYWENDAKVPKADRDTCKDIAAQLVDDNPNINVRTLDMA